MSTNSQKRAQEKYNKAHTKMFSLKFNERTDRDILDKLDSVVNKQGYIKGLIRSDIKSGQSISDTVYVHYGSREYIPELFIPIKNLPASMAKIMNKPEDGTGLWASPEDGGYTWIEFCQDNSYKTYEKDNLFRFTLKPGSKVCHIRQRSDIWRLQKNGVIDFESVRDSGVDAIELHLSENPHIASSMPLWGCDSILIMNPYIISPKI